MNKMNIKMIWRQAVIVACAVLFIMYVWISIHRFIDERWLVGAVFVFCAALYGWIGVDMIISVRRLRAIKNNINE